MPTKILTRRSFLLYSALAGSSLSRAASQEGGAFRAIVVGVSQYESGYQTLIAGQDATRLAATLRKLGYEQPLLISGYVKKQELLDRLKFLLNSLEPEDTLLFFFGGHGSRRQRLDSKGNVVRDAEGRTVVEEYLLFSDTKDEKFEATALSMSELEKELGRCVARRRIFVVDACRTTSVPTRKSRNEKIGFQGDEKAVEAAYKKYQARLDRIARAKPEGFKGTVEAAVLWSCKPGQLSYEPLKPTPEATGVFTERILRALEGGLSGTPTVGALRDFITASMPADLPGPQTPDLSGTAGRASIIFAPRPVVAVATERPAGNPERPVRNPERPATVGGNNSGGASLATKPPTILHRTRKGGAGMCFVPRKNYGTGDFWLDTTPVTVSQYRAYCEATGKNMPSAPSWGWIDDHPIVNVTWHDASGYADWVGEGARLPKSYEFEYAARDGWGDVWDGSKVWSSVKPDDADRTAPVKRNDHIFVNSFGLSDMVGNVWQWCSDGPDNASKYVKGGSWYTDNPSFFRVGYNGKRALDKASDDIGFRLLYPGP